MYQSDPAQVQAPATGFARLQRAVVSALLAAALLYVSCMLGIWSRPSGFIATLWPANAILLGVMVRWPRLSGPAGWLGAFAGYVLADLSAGGPPMMTLWLTLANLAGVFTGWTLFLRLEPEEQRLQRPGSVLHLFGICTAAAAAAALIGGGITTSQYAQDTLTGLSYWFIGELASYVILLPVVLTWPGLRRVALLRRSADYSGLLTRSIPALALAASMLAAMAIGGPGAIFFPIPALLWCALTYRLFVVALLTMAAVVWAQIYSSRIMPSEVLASFMHAATSMRLGLTLLALAPLTVASINTARNRLLAELEHAAHHDHLSGALTRSAFVKRGTQAWLAHAPSRCHAAALMLCLDGFRQVDDQYGYWAGDRILQAFARQARMVLREEDIFGRLGDEEFGLLLFGASRQESLAVGERLRAAVENMEILLEDGSRLAATITVGVTWMRDLNDTSLDRLLIRADAALHRAKKAGRNRVVDDADEHTLS